MSTKQAQEDILHDVFCFGGIHNTHRDEIDNLIAML
jgi:hypothetical protein